MRKQYGKSIAVGFAFIMALAPAIHAQDIEGAMDKMSDEARYQLKQKGDAFIRLDRKNGQMSVCKLNGENLVCRMAADDRATLVEELDSLQERIAMLENREGVGKRQRPRSQERKGNDDHGFPLDEEIDEAMKYSSKVIRRFFDVMKELREDLKD